MKKLHQNPKVATIIGNVGAGKSSSMPIICKTLSAEAVEADDLFQTTDPFREDFLNDLPRWALANELWLTLERAKLINKKMSKSKKEWLVIDSGLLMSWVYMYSHYSVGKVTPAEWKLFQDLFDEIAGNAIPDVLIWLNYSFDTLLSRIAKRGRDYEMKYYTIDYLAQLEIGLKTLVEKLRKSGVMVVEISEDEVADFVANENDTTRLSEKISGSVKIHE